MSYRASTLIDLQPQNSRDKACRTARHRYRGASSSPRTSAYEAENLILLVQVTLTHDTTPHTQTMAESACDRRLVSRKLRHSYSYSLLTKCADQRCSILLTQDMKLES